MTRDPPAASEVMGLLRGDRPPAESPQDWLARLIARRADFGITRVGSVTRLDRIGIPVVQVARPLAFSNAVSQGKGTAPGQALASGLMEAVETWAAERIADRDRLRSPFSAQPPDVAALFGPWLGGAPEDWRERPVPWIDGWDLLAGRVRPVPMALVDTVYTLPSPHPCFFPRVTTGLGAGRSLAGAVCHAGLEILERDAIARAYRREDFHDRWQTDPAPLLSAERAGLLAGVGAAGFVCGFWQAPAAHDLPVYLCHVMEGDRARELAPLPAQGSGCDTTHERAMEKALLEACQARLTAISGAREDVTRRHYPAGHDRPALAAWRDHLAHPPRLRWVEDPPLPETPSDVGRLERVIGALRQAGAEAAIVVPLHSDPALGLHVARLLAPPLILDPGARA
ncbi:YcaO-like family protein [Microvirga pudoricolor]|uniref:YcaO-like family protein n=1 Tax=Microvirga pudoricolor TaxID=2778729 RepID=UPI00194F6FF5|nr:YcaO-like family protein [Microvirga pudoricolor]MBM6594041.1 YcaO-like family protein [Microvirga pudoricolor]